MRKLFALVATMAMVLSMFAGIAFAAPTPPKAVVTLNNGTFIWGEDSYRLTGTITVNGSVPADVLTYTLTVEGSVEYKGVTTNGTIDLTVPASAMLVNKDYTLSFTGNDTMKYTIDNATVKTRYNLVLDQDLSGVKYLDKNVVVSGRLLNSKGAAVAGVEVTATGAAAPMNTLSNGSFALVISEVQVGGKDALVITAAGVTYKAVTVAPLAFSTFTVSPLSTIHTAINTNLAFVTKEKVGTSAESAITSNVTFTLTGVKILASSVTAADIDTANSVKTTDNLYYTKLIITKHSTSVQFAEAGTVNIVADWQGKRVGTTTMEVQAPAAVNVLNIPSQMGVVSTPVGMDVRMPNGTYPATVKVSAVGAGYKLDEAVVARDAGDSLYHFNLNPTQQGTIVVTVKAYDASNNLIDTFTKEVTVKGYTITISKSEVVVGEANDIVVTVFDGETAINNATVTIAGKSVSPLTTNISNGTYLFDDEVFGTVGTYAIVVSDPVTGATKANIANAFTVLGQEVYTVTMDKAALLGGSTTPVVFTVTDANGNRISGATVNIYIDGTTTAMIGVSNTDVWGEVTVDVTPTKSMTVVAATDSNTKIGKYTADVKQPIIQISQDKATEGYKELVTVTLINPLTGLELEGYKLVAVNSYTTHSLFTKADKAVAYDLTAAAAASKYEFYVMATDARTTQNKEDGKVAELLFNVKKDSNATVEVKQAMAVVPATLSLSHDTMYLESNTQLTITLADAHEVGLKNREVKLNGVVIGNTDDNGVIVYNYRPLATGNYNFTTVKDNAAVITTTAKAVIDTVAPVIEATAKQTADGVVVSGKVTDNTKVVRVIVNNTEVVVIPGAEVEFTYTLPAATKSVTVMAFDVAGVGVLANPAIEAPASVTIQGTQVERKGANLFVQIRQFEELGATLKWDAATKTATFTVGETVVKVTVGSTTATVNGVAKTMPAAPFLSNGRTMAPTRFISEALGWKVDWAAGDIVTITLP